jgi:hypothetical protein
MPTKDTKDSVDDANLQQQKHDITPASHLKHLLNIGWLPDSTLIQKYVFKHHLEAQLDDYRIEHGLNILS